MTDQSRSLGRAPQPFYMDFDVSTIKHLGLQMYSTLPPVVGELIANAWDANATSVQITIPETPIDELTSEIVIVDNGIGMSDEDIRRRYLIVGRDRREQEGADRTSAPFDRPIMGRKGIGKFSAFGIAKEIEIESVSDGECSRFVMNYDKMLDCATQRRAEFMPLAPTGHVTSGTAITLRQITKFKTRSISLTTLRRGLARRFATVGPQHNFDIVINGSPISVVERDLQQLLDKDAHGDRYLWPYEDVEIEPNTGWTVSGWIGALDRTTPSLDGVDRGISIMARGKLVQEPFLFNAVVGQQYALSYIVGELHAEFVDGLEDTIGTNRNALVWDTDANTRLMAWGKEQVNKIAREWARKRSDDNQRRLQQNDLYREFRERADGVGNKRALDLADRLVRQVVSKNPTAGVQELEPVIRTSLDFLEFDAFWEITQDLAKSDVEDVGRLFTLFREWEIVEAKEMSRVTEGRIATIEKLQALIERDTLEVPTLHNFLKEFPWVIDPRWTLVDDEVRYSDVLRGRFSEPHEMPESDRRIDFLCVREGTNLVVVEIKRAQKKASDKELDQIERYVAFMRDHVQKTTDPDFLYQDVVRYLLCGDLVDTTWVRQKRQNLERSRIFVRRYADLLEMVKRVHREFIQRYGQLKERSRPSTA